MRQSYHPLYPVWRAMINRCYNTRSTAYKFYGKRGIRVCSDWLNSFEQFLKDMGPKPFTNASIDRKNGKADYSASNCRWATQKEQCRNSANNRLLTLNGKTQCVAAWAEELQIPQARIAARLKLGWSDKKALTQPRWQKLITFKGITKPLRDWAKEYGLRPTTLHFRLSSGWSIANALQIPRMTVSQCGRLAWKNHRHKQL